ncbi:ribonuclease J [Oenococcus kitaharae]|uniref:Ribonuclease J n=1 Tax=Oenococcus kitaharae DSM 17330 TaxID=1045004 RepID=G9WJQ4_9LACO|nr:ribonuclease J [Oenococcus kitaharae]EHN59253.1 Zn-dependent hydrolase [Oenococcus kitaharae DSM 17330]OEY82220.1 Zn-dependent hydrolase [Oenococcus kitaharae]OEY82643.1 Zn-dependent hydrolase [Oenococcus kitaharae]OEY84900.1 Zn-dependent hydrolase [Oenococcus kitaharae]
MVNTSLSIIPFGGVRENGKNMYAVTVNDEIYILDAGLKYPETDLLGVDVVVPDFNYLIDHADQVVGVFLTHGHADSIGALPYLLEALRVPVFGTEFTLALAKEQVAKRPSLSDFNDYNVITPDSVVEFGKTKVSFFSTTHSIPESVGIVLETEYGQVVYTGDFKFDNTAQVPYKTDYARLTQIGQRGVLALLADSNGVELPGESANESAIDEFVFQTFRENADRRIIVATVASNVQRIQEVINASFQTGRKIAISGNDLEQVVKTALDSKRLQLPTSYNKLFTNIKNLKSVEPNKLVILETGKMGEPVRDLWRMANGDDRYVSFNDKDLIFIATTPSVASESIMAKTRDMIFRRGANVISIKDHVHSSGHASQNDLQFMLNFMKPTYFFPVSGEYRVFSVADFLAQEVGIKKENIFLSMKGDQYKLNPETKQFKLEDSFEVDDTMIDGSGNTDVGNIVLRDRKMLSEDGVVIAAATIDRKKKKVVAAPRITTRGFIFVKTNRDLIHDSAKAMVDQIELYLANSEDFDWNDLKSGVKEALSKFFYEKTKRRPVVMPVVMEVNQNRRPNNKKKGDNASAKKEAAEDTKKPAGSKNRKPRQRVKSTPRSIRPKKETMEKINAQLAERKQLEENNV